MMLCRILVMLLTSVAIAGCGSTNANPSKLRSNRLDRFRPPFDAMMLQPGDKIQIQLHIPERPGGQVLSEVIDDRGAVTLQYIGQVRIGGLTSSMAEKVLKDEYVRRKIYRADAIEVSIVPPEKVFYVRGFVNRPGLYLFTRNLTAVQAVSLAGGRTEFAHQRIIKVYRGANEYTVDEDRVRNKTEADRLIEPGDIVEVPRGWI